MTGYAPDALPSDIVVLLANPAKKICSIAFLVEHIVDELRGSADFGMTKAHVNDLIVAESKIYLIIIF